MKPRRTRVRSIGGDIARGLRELAASSTSGSFEAYRDRPVEFFREVLGWEPWSKQREIAEAYVEHDWLTVVSANGVGKSALAGAIGIHFLLTHGPGCRVIVTGPKFQTVQEVSYKEMQGHIRRALVPLGLDVAALASTGIRDSHGRQLIGWTAEHAERFQGVRAPEMLVICEESSGISDPIFEAILSLLTGGGKLLLIGNGTKTRGFFYESHKSDRFKRFAISALDSPNVAGTEPRVPGLVTRQMVRGRRAPLGARLRALQDPRPGPVRRAARGAALLRRDAHRGRAAVGNNAGDGPARRRLRSGRRRRRRR